MLLICVQCCRHWLLSARQLCVSVRCSVGVMVSYGLFAVFGR